jgi:manganese oxidase
LYWAEFPNGRDDTTGLLSGAFVVDPPGSSAADRIFVIQLWARNLFHRDFAAALALNGKAWPYTERVQARVGQPEHWRVINATPIVHPMHLHGFYFLVDAVGDGESERRYADSERRMAVTENLMPHATFDMTWKPERAGNWLFHCHILDHMSGYYSPVLFGPDGPEAAPYHGKSHGGEGMGMAKLVLGISVTDDQVRPTPARAAVASEQRHLFVRQRPARPYQPAGPGFYLEGVSREVEPIGPPLVITRGVRTAITVTNELQEPTAVHWHGLEIESYYDGVPGWAGSSQQTTPPIAPGASFVAYMTPPRAGTFIYHTHWHDAGQLTGGLYGALIVLPPGEQFNSATDKVFVLGRGGSDELHDPLLLNGNPQPHTMVLLAGKTYRVRLINITPTDPEIEVSLRNGEHAAKWRALAKDGADLPASQATMKDAVQVISVGETYDFAFAPQEPGAYALRFCSEGNEVTQMVVVVPPNAPFSVFAREVAANQNKK